MIKVIKSKEKNCISGGWTCDQTYTGLPFEKATWNVHHHDISKNGGVCFYKANNTIDVYYFTPENRGLTVDSASGRWFIIDNSAGVSSYECHESNASKCVFKEG